MGNHNISECIFTGLPVTPIIDGVDSVEYVVNINGKNRFISLPWEALNWNSDVEFFKQNKLLLNQLLQNNNWFETPKQYITIDKLKILIKEKEYPRTPKQKLEKLFLEMTKRPRQDGETIILDNKLQELLIDKAYLKSSSELRFYFGTLGQSNLIKLISSPTYSYRITFEGLEHKIKLEEEGEQSNKCFIAMSFKNKTKEIRNAIKNAVIETGFEPVLIDEKNIDSERTINDEIITNLKKCNFCIADFTFHSNGVYFESGFALGQRKKVIYTCREDEFKDAHFDIRPLQHIVYKTSEELQKDLVSKIEAWIK